MTRVIDISPMLNATTAVFPGDQPFVRKVAINYDQGNNFLLSSVEMSMHLGAHTDAPNHYDPKGVGIEARDLSIYYGPAQVLTVQCPRGARITVEDLKGRTILAPRVLFRTLSFPNPQHWNDDFNSLSPELIDFLATKKVKLVGIDTPSIDPSDSKPLESHASVRAHDMAILEGIVLDKISDGMYTLAAFPLKMQDADASPVRAVLITE